MPSAQVIATHVKDKLISAQVAMLQALPQTYTKESVSMCALMVSHLLVAFVCHVKSHVLLARAHQLSAAHVMSKQTSLYSSVISVMIFVQMVMLLIK